MKKIQREDLHIISRYSNLPADKVAQALKEHVHNDQAAWHRFFRLLFISLGVGFTVSGIVFFFAYNWEDLPKFAKIGLAEGVLIATVSFLLFAKVPDNTRNIVLTGASVLVGVLFAVFGQIYQTGANAYDFFLAWSIFVTLWVLVSNFAPLWLLFLVLINTTFVLYSQQVAKDWSEILVCTVLFIINSAVLIAALYFGKKRVPNWFMNTVALAAASFATIGLVIGIFGKYEPAFLVLILTTAIVYALSIWHALTTKSVFYLSVIPFSLIVIVSALLINASDGEGMFLMVSLFIVTSVTLTILNLINFQKRWANENQ